MIPPNDGGIALGQAFYGMNHECVEEVRFYRVKKKGIRKMCVGLQLK